MYTSIMGFFRNPIHFSRSSLQHSFSWFLMFLIFDPLFDLFPRYRLWNGKLLKNFEKKRIRYDTWKFYFWPGSRDTTVHKSFRCSLFLILLHSNVHSLASCLNGRIDRISHSDFVKNTFIIAYFLASFFLSFFYACHHVRMTDIDIDSVENRLENVITKET